VGITSVTWTAKDAANNAGTCIQKVTLNDTIMPYFTNVPSGNFVIDTQQNACAATQIPYLLGLFTASDSCSSVTLTQAPAAGTQVTSAITPITITATDLSGNTINYYVIFQANDTVNHVVTPTVLVSASEATICQGNGDTLSATGTNGGSSPLYIWLLNNQPVSFQNIYTTDSLISSDVVKCIFISNAACASTDTVVSADLSVTVNPIPGATIFPAGPISICQGDSALISAPAGNASYHWNTAATSQSISVQVTGNYTVTVTNANNCTAVSAPVDITVAPLPAVPTITQSHDTLTSSAASTYQWYLNDTAINNAMGRTIVITRNGNYTVQVTDSGNCYNVSAVHNVTGLGVDNIIRGYEVQLFPNPNNGNFTLRFSDNQVHYVWLCDVAGRSICVAEPVTGHKDFDASALSSGVYLLEIKDESGLQTLRMVVQR
jgi:hypothetical protein